MKKRVLLMMALLLSCAFAASAQEYDPELLDTLKVVSTKHVQKRYNIYFSVGSSRIDRSFHGNGRVLDVMKSDIRTTINADKIIPDSLLILSTASPDGNRLVNKRLAEARAESTRKYLLQMFPEFKNATILVDYLEENWDGLRQVLKTHPEFPQRDEMLAIIDGNTEADDKEAALRACREGWRYLMANHVYSLRNSSVTMCVIMDGVVDEFVRKVPVENVERFAYVPEFTAPEPETVMHNPGYTRTIEWKKMIFAPRMNLLVPGFNIGVEVPIKDNWSVGADVYFPWLLDKGNRWCAELMAGFVDAKYWFPGKNYEWTRTERLQGHAVGVYAGTGLYDFQWKRDGAQGEFIDFGVDYTFALPLADNKLRMEFNIGLGFLRTWYRPYYTSSDYTDLIKEPGIKYNATNFIGPTRANISLVVPIVVRTKAPKAYRTGGEQ